MISTNAVIMIIGIVFLLDSLIVIIFPKWCLKATRRWFKTQKSLKKIAVIELLASLVILLIGMNI